MTTTQKIRIGWRSNNKRQELMTGEILALMCGWKHQKTINVIYLKFQGLWPLFRPQFSVLSVKAQVFFHGVFQQEVLFWIKRKTQNFHEMWNTESVFWLWELINQYVVDLVTFPLQLAVVSELYSEIFSMTLDGKCFRPGDSYLFFNLVKMTILRNVRWKKNAIQFIGFHFDQENNDKRFIFLIFQFLLYNIFYNIQSSHKIILPTDEKNIRVWSELIQTRITTVSSTKIMQC